MSLVVEDGTGLANAESYTSVAEADQYFADRGISQWATYSVTQKEQSLRKATDYIDARFTFKGVKLTEAQALQFPRNVSGPLPVCLKRATSEYALRAAAAPLVADPVTEANGMRVKRKFEKLGPMEEETEYGDGAPAMFKPYPAADMLLKSLVRSSGVVVR